MGTLADRLGSDLKEAMRAGDAVRRDEIRGLLAALTAERQARLTRELARRGLILHGEHEQLSAEQQAQVDQLRASFDLSGEDELAVLQQRVKQHRQSIASFEQGRRSDLVTAELAQLSALEPYLPRQLSDAELDEAIRQAIVQAGAQGPREQGKVMAVISQRYRGQVDMQQVASRVQAHLVGAGATG